MYSTPAHPLIKTTSIQMRKNVAVPSVGLSNKVSELMGKTNMTSNEPKIMWAFGILSSTRATVKIAEDMIGTISEVSAAPTEPL